MQDTLLRKAAIVGTGSYLPETIRTNEWFEKFELLTSGTEIFDDSGVKERRVVSDEMKSSGMEILACQDALKKTGIKAEEIDLILCNSNIHDQLQPGNAFLIQHKLGAKNAGAFNFDSACTSFINCLIIANSMIAGGECETILIVSSTTWTRVADYTEKKCMLMGDGAGAVILKPAKTEGRGYLGSYFISHGDLYYTMGRKVKKPEGWKGERTYYNGDPEKLYLFIDRTKEGLDKIRELGPVQTVEITKKALQKCGLTIKDIDFFITHQPAKFILEAWRNSLGLKEGQYYDTLARYGNLSNASIPVNLDGALRLNMLQDDDIVAFSSHGMGVNVSSAIFRWGI
ncbi:MAG: 3-oxoacyl-ACP synthase III family protein [Nitrospinae bacterium]|nr:3-oxoacyl-ACP synthase III family protein [Nitrospinota bacterium]